MFSYKIIKWNPQINTMNDVTQRIKDFLPSFIANVEPNTYLELCLGFDKLSSTINNSEYSEIISIINCYTSLINDSYKNDSSSDNYLIPLMTYCKKKLKL